MPVPNSDVVCRFIRPSEWSSVEKAPKKRRLKEQDMSVWSIGGLGKMSASLADLQIQHLEGSGQLNLAVQDYLNQSQDEMYISLDRTVGGHPFRA